MINIDNFCHEAIMISNIHYKNNIFNNLHSFKRSNYTHGPAQILIYFSKQKKCINCSLLYVIVIPLQSSEKSRYLSVKISHRRINSLLVRQLRRLFREIRLSKNFHDDIFVCPRDRLLAKKFARLN